MSETVPDRQIVKIRAICGRAILDHDEMALLGDDREDIRHALPDFTFNPFFERNFPEDFEAPYRMNWETLGFCNMDCKFCFADFNHAGQNRKVVESVGIEKASKQLSTDEAQALIYQAAKMGTKQFLFGGGDPFIRADMPALIEYAHHMGLQVIVDTNGLVLGSKPELFDKVAPFIHQLGISLDGSEPTRHDIFREKPGSFAKVMSLLDMTDPLRDLRVKINTIVTAENADDVVNIAELMKDRRIARISFDQFIPLRSGAQHQGRYEISDDDYLAVVQQIRASVGELGIDFEIGGGVSTSKEGTVFMVGPQGIPYTAQNDQKHYVNASVRDVPLHELATMADLDLRAMNQERYAAGYYQEA